MQHRAQHHARLGQAWGKRHYADQVDAQADPVERVGGRAFQQREDVDQYIHTGQGITDHRHIFAGLAQQLQVHQAVGDLAQPVVYRGGSSAEVFTEQGFERRNRNLDLTLAGRGRCGGSRHRG